MNNQEIIEKLTIGNKKTETVKVNDAEITLRPLTAGELTELQILEKQGFTMKIGMNNQGKRQNMQTNDLDINAGEFNKYQSEAMYKAIAWSMNIPEEEIKNFQVGIPEQIFQHVIRISSLTDNDLTVIKNFRKNE